MKNEELVQKVKDVHSQCEGLIGLDYHQQKERKKMLLTELTGSVGLEHILNASEEILSASSRSRSTYDDMIEDFMLHYAEENKDALSDAQKDGIFSVLASHCAGNLATIRGYAAKLDIILTQERAKKIQAGLIENGVPIVDFYDLQLEFDLPFNQEVAKSYVESALKDHCTHVRSEYALRLIDFFKIGLKDEQIREFVKTMFENGNLNDAKAVAEHFGLDSSWMDKTVHRNAVNKLEKALADSDNNVISAKLGYSSRKTLQRFAKNHKQFEEMLKVYAMASKAGGCFTDGNILDQMPEAGADLVGARLKVLLDSKDEDMINWQLNNIYNILKRHRDVGSGWSEEQASKIKEIAKERYLNDKEGGYLYQYLIAHDRFKIDEAELRELSESKLDKGMKMLDYITLSENSGIRLNDLEDKIFAKLEELVEKDELPDNYKSGLIGFIESLHQNVSSKHVKYVMKNTGLYKWSRLIEEYGMPEMDESEKKQMFTQVLQGTTSSSEVETAMRLAPIFGVKVGPKDFEHFVRDKIYEDKKGLSREFSRYAGLSQDRIEEIWKHTGMICADEVLQAYLNCGKVNASVDLGKRIGKEQEVLDYMIDHRNDTFSGGGISMDTNWIVKTAVDMGKSDYLLNKLVEHGDINWISRAVTTLVNEKKYNLENPQAFVFSIIGLQERLVEQGRYDGIQRLKEIFPKLPVHSAYEEYRASLN